MPDDGPRAAVAAAAGSRRLRSVTAAGLRRTRPGALARKAARHSRLVLAQRVDGTPAAGALARAWGWQLWRRLVRRPVTIRCAEGSLLISPPWSRVSAVIAATGLTERDDAIFVLDLLRAGDLFVDVGANIGFYSVLAARRGARVEAYEPNPQAASACERTLALNGVAGRARVHRAACGQEQGTVAFTTGLDIANHIARDGEQGIEVPLRTLDAELGGLEAPLCMLKVDAEGHDVEVLRGARAAIDRLAPVILVEVWTGGAGALEALAGLGYHPYRYDARARELIALAPGERRAGNLLMVADRSLALVAERLRGGARPCLRPPAVSWRAAARERAAA